MCSITIVKQIVFSRNVRAETEGRWPCVDGRPIDYLGNARRRKSKYCGASVQQVQSKERCDS